jgi:hypothetical protein
MRRPTLLVGDTAACVLVLAAVGCLLVYEERAHDVLLCGTLTEAVPLSCEDVLNLGVFLRTQGERDTGRELAVYAQRRLATERTTRLLLLGASALLLVGGTGLACVCLLRPAARGRGPPSRA